MSNVAISIKGSDEIKTFLINAVRIEKRHGFGRYQGAGGKSRTIREALFDTKWTNDIANPVLDEAGEIIGYDKKMSDLATDGENAAILKPSKADFSRAVKLCEFVGNLTQQQVINHVRDVFGNLPQGQREALEKLYLMVWGINKRLDNKEQS